ncbi:MAG: S-methyl-5-thioribose-1-phosphate isomerase [Dehalococcoidia bacterium]|nr:S-methyl-5-thioribose-1-phosphate isomerase [Dehalococcoidia bacterium]
MHSLEWSQGKLRILDQTLLPKEIKWLDCSDYRQVVEAIQMLRVRGAPAIGVAGAYATVLAAQEQMKRGGADYKASLQKAAEEIASARPTAVNLRWAVDRVMRAVAKGRTLPETMDLLLQESQRIQREDEAANKALGEAGAKLLPKDAVVMTHCNTGSLATAGYGTALGIIRSAWASGKLKQVFATETRPLLQGARLTTWELMQESIPVTLMADSAAAFTLSQGKVTCVILGADRIAANGDTANKVGTHMLAVLAKEYGVPFYVAAPTSTVDLLTASGKDIPIEERKPEEVRGFGGTQTAPDGVPVYNPAFDVTPAKFITAIITEQGIAKPPYTESLKLLMREAAAVAAKAAGRG